MRTIRLGLLLALLAVTIPASGRAAAPYPVAPTVTTLPAGAVTSSGATLHGTLNPNGTATSYAFDWGTTPGYGHATALSPAGSGRSPVGVAAALGGLHSATTYHFRLIAVTAGVTTYGGDATFKTAKVPVPAPSASTGSAANITAGSAEVSGTVNPRGHAATYLFQYGSTTGYGSQTPLAAAGNGTTAVTARAGLSGLARHTLYHYRLVATSAGGTTYGVDRTFVTGRPGATPSTARVIGHRAFVSPRFRAGIPLGCFGGGRRCAGTITLVRGTRLLGRARFDLAPQSGALVEVRLARAGRHLLGRGARRRLVRVRAVITTTIGRGSASVPVTLVPTS
jgi:hypothetical protein